jgi:hypothetical protein
MKIGDKVVIYNPRYCSRGWWEFDFQETSISRFTGNKHNPVVKIYYQEYIFDKNTLKCANLISDKNTPENFRKPYIRLT